MKRNIMSRQETKKIRRQRRDGERAEMEKEKRRRHGGRRRDKT